MAQNSTIFKIDLQISDMDRHYYASHTLTLARHPSETDERMMIRVLAFALNASEYLVFGKGMSAEDEPDLWEKDLTGSVQRWIDVGQPDEKRVRKACGVSREVLIYPYSGNSADMWWEQNKRHLEKLDKVSVINIPQESTEALGKMAQRSLQLQCTIQDGEIWFTDSTTALQVQMIALKTAS
jgi:uncharacterized protein YaeQ